MASIFTYDPDPPRVSSPWLTPRDSGTPSPKGTTGRSKGRTPPPGLLSDYNVTKLEPEPQTTSTEYKLHLLLRPRRTYTTFSTGRHISGSQQSKQPSRRSDSSQGLTPIPAPSSQTRQSRLLQLTTQLLWRLQQSSPYHATATSELVLPKLPEDTHRLEAPSRPGKLLAGLAESRGALYEIGVSDDGTFVGLTEDEMEESLTNLRAMAASLGCNVEVTRKVLVGNCEWQVSSSEASTDSITETKPPNYQPITGFQRAQLWVAEALVTPDLTYETGDHVEGDSELNTTLSSLSIVENTKEATLVLASGSSADQLRITLTGPTTSGKSSLLGTLSTATLDNGRGKSRLSLLKHRHELVSGVTSSVAQELLGYKPSMVLGHSADVINFAAGNVTSWTDIHASVEDGRLVFVCDSAGHPRYRRTTVRGMVGWAPHWTLLCVAADDGENAPTAAGGTSSAQDILGVSGAGIDLAKAHLDLCLKLDKPLVVVITKLDLASKSSLRQTLAKILSAIKAAGRVPAMLPPDQTKNIVGSDLEAVPDSDAIAVQKIVQSMNKADLKSLVPIIMTSAAKGTGIRLLHALLDGLPIPDTPTSRDYVADALNPEQPSCLFHIEDIFGFPASYATQTDGAQTNLGTVVAGHLRFGKLSMGDNIVVGPFPADIDDGFSDRPETRTPPLRSSQRASPGRPTNEASVSEYGSFAHPSTTELGRIASRAANSASVAAGEWYNAHIVSIRNLRLPVHSLEAGQVGTIGIVLDLPEEEVSNGPFERSPPQAPRLRKGMVLAVPSRHMVQTGHSLQAASGFTASFEDGDVTSVMEGSIVVIYIASIRASAKVLRLAPNVTSAAAVEVGGGGGDGDVFGLDALDTEEESDAEKVIFGTDGVTDVTLELLTNREWIELGSQVLIMPGGGQGLYYGSERGEKGVAGLEGFVGRVIEVVD